MNTKLFKILKNNLLCIYLYWIDMVILLLAGKRSPVRIRYSPPVNTGLQEFLTFEAFFICTQIHFKYSLVLFVTFWLTLIVLHWFLSAFL